MRKGYVMSEGLLPKEFRKLFESDALVCIDRCNKFEQYADEKIQEVIQLYKTGKISRKEAERISETILIKAKKSQRKKRKKRY